MTRHARLLIAFFFFVVFSTLSSAQAPVPFINQPLLPDAIAPGSADFTLTINGSGFVSGSVVDWNGTALPTTFVSGSRLTATVSAIDVATASTAWLTVVNSGPGGGISNVVFFPITISTSSVSFSRVDLTVGTHLPAL
jgi:hypothetical protein